MYKDRSNRRVCGNVDIGPSRCVLIVLTREKAGGFEWVQWKTNLSIRLPAKASTRATGGPQGFQQDFQRLSKCPTAIVANTNAEAKRESKSGRRCCGGYCR